jgi:hypothetical protein
MSPPHVQWRTLPALDLFRRKKLRFDTFWTAHVCIFTLCFMFIAANTVGCRLRHQDARCTVNWLLSQYCKASQSTFICSWMQLWFLCVVSKHLKFSALLKDSYLCLYCDVYLLLFTRHEHVLNFLTQYLRAVVHTNRKLCWASGLTTPRCTIKSLVTKYLTKSPN